MAVLRVDVHPQRDVVRVATAGELDLANSAALQAQLSELRDAGFQHVVLDLRELTFMDSAGVRLIVDEDQSGPQHRAALLARQGERGVSGSFALGGRRADLVRDALLGDAHHDGAAPRARGDDLPR